MIKVTVFQKHGGPLSKRLSIDAEGRLVKDSSACWMSEGKARVHALNADQPFGALAGVIFSLKSHQALAMGTIAGLQPEQPVKVVTKAKLDGQENTIARDRDHVVFEPDQPAMVLLDYDTDGMPGPVRERIEEAGGVFEALEKHVWPELARAGRVERASTSAGLKHKRKKVEGADGRHVFVAILDGRSAAPSAWCSRVRRSWTRG
jgi:hypothetical protein